MATESRELRSGRVYSQFKLPTAGDIADFVTNSMNQQKKFNFTTSNEVEQQKSCVVQLQDKCANMELCDDNQSEELDEVEDDDSSDDTLDESSQEDTLTVPQEHTDEEHSANIDTTSPQNIIGAVPQDLFKHATSEKTVSDILDQKNDEDEESDDRKKLINEVAQAMGLWMEGSVMSKLNNIETLLNDSKVGLIQKTSTLEKSSLKMRKTLYKKKSGLVAKYDAVQNTLYNGPDSVTTVLTNNKPLIAKINPIQDTVNKVEAALQDPEHSEFEICKKVVSLESKIGRAPAPAPDGSTLVPEEVKDNKRKCDQLAEQLEMTGEIVDGLYREMASMKRQVTANMAKLSANDLVIGGIRVEENEEEEEDTKAATLRFLENKLGLKPDPNGILDAFRSKNSTERVIKKKMVTIPPVMFVHTTEPIRKLILRNTWKLKKLKDDIDGYGYYIKQSMPEEWRANRAKNQKDYDETREKNNNLKEGETATPCYFSGGRYYKNGQIIEEKIPPPSPREMINMSRDTYARVMAVKFTSSRVVEKKRSTFQGFAALVATADHIRLAYMRIKKEQISADHIMMGYRLKVNDDIFQCSTSNGENFGDQELLKILEEANNVNVALFVARHYGGILLGNDRFKQIREVASEALAEVHAMVYEVPKTQRPQPNKNKGRGGGYARGGFAAAGSSVRGGYAAAVGRGNGYGRGRGEPP